ncbi:MAG: hypothetical protein KAX26_04105, partial [Anaerolineae bacterium]|nr:hypothetical protein [Anaerolineae bacterium]
MLYNLHCLYCDGYPVFCASDAAESDSRGRRVEQLSWLWCFHPVRRPITEIACHARGANFIYGPTVRTVLDMGGQDCKAIHCDERGKVVSFLMNDKCAAGTGRGMEVFADLLSVPIEQMGDVSLEVKEEPPMVSSTCVVFAKSEAVGLLREGWPKAKVLAAYHAAMAHRVVNLLERVGMEKDFAITGGISKN